MPIVVVYGIQLTPTHEHEIALWSGVEYHDAARFLIPTKDVLSFTRNATVRGNVVAAASLRISTLSAERLYLLKLTLLNAACRRFGSCVFIDVRHAIHSATALTNMATMLSTHGYLFGCDDEGVGTPTNVTTAVPTATPTIAHCPVVGFVYESFAYVNLVVEPLTCLRMGDCDERRVLDTMAGEDLEIRMVDQVLGVADEAIIKNGAFYYCYISLREDLLYSYRFAMDGANVEPAVLKSNNKIHIGLGVPTTGKIIGGRFPCTICTSPHFPLSSKEPS